MYFQVHCAKYTIFNIYDSTFEKGAYCGEVIYFQKEDILNFKIMFEAGLSISQVIAILKSDLIVIVKL